MILHRRSKNLESGLNWVVVARRVEPGLCAVRGVPLPCHAAPSKPMRGAGRGNGVTQIKSRTCDSQSLMYVISERTAHLLLTDRRPSTRGQDLFEMNSVALLEEEEDDIPPRFANVKVSSPSIHDAHPCADIAHERSGVLARQTVNHVDRCRSKPRGVSQGQSRTLGQLNTGRLHIILR